MGREKGSCDPEDGSLKCLQQACPSRFGLGCCLEWSGKYRRLDCDYETSHNSNGRHWIWYGERPSGEPRSSSGKRKAVGKVDERHEGLSRIKSADEGRDPPVDHRAKGFVGQCQSQAREAQE